MNDGNCIGLTGKIITREDRDYNESIKAWNRAINKHPFIIVYCYTEEDVINAIKWSRENSKEIRVRSGAHSYEGYSTGDGVVVIDVSNINYIDINEEKGYVKIGGGVRNREAYEALGKKGYPFPGGGCPTVGVPGLILGGGWGYSARYLGLASDSLLEAEIINYKGQKLIVNRNQNKDLFWAIMGSGGCNFGVITSMTLKIEKKEEMGSLIYIKYHNATPDTILKAIIE
ncbi:MAG: FAD-binding oxidoreductase, partial [Clostridium sp.]